MAEDSKIQWTDATFNPWRGCERVSPACDNCYAEQGSGRNPKVLGKWGPVGVGTRVVGAEDYWKLPVRWNAKAKATGTRTRVFCLSYGDVFEDWQGDMHATDGRKLFFDAATGDWYTEEAKGQPLTVSLTMIDVRARLFRLIDDTPNLDWLLLTKRPENVLTFAFDAWCKPVPGHVSQNEGDGRRWAFPPNVWMGTTVEDQARADLRIPHLLKVPARVRFLSLEPLLGEVEFRSVPGLNKLPAVHMAEGRGPAGIDWVILGGESESPAVARPTDLRWMRSIIAQCKAANVACFVKQLGSMPESDSDEDAANSQNGTRYALGTLLLKNKKGGDMAEWPEDLRVREFPT